MPLVNSWKYALLRRFPILLKTKWGKRFCAKIIEEQDLVKLVRQENTYMKLLWVPFNEDHRLCRERRAMADEALDKEVNDLFPILQKMDIHGAVKEGSVQSAVVFEKLAHGLPIKSAAHGHSEMEIEMQEH